MTLEERAALLVAELEDRISTLEARLARSRKVRDRLRQRLGRRVPQRPRRERGDDGDDDLHARGFF
jgi:hypothetical protein